MKNCNPQTEIQDLSKPHTMLNYFNSKEPAPTIEVGVKGRFKLEYKYLDGLISEGMMKSLNFDIDNAVLNKEMLKVSFAQIQKIHGDNTGLQRISKNTKGSILIFLPGIYEITLFLELFVEYFSKNKEQFELIPLHSTICDSINLDKIFYKNINKRKIIVATNIAESSITVPDVKFIIDFCLVKHIKYNIRIKNSKLELCWASQASLI